MTSVLVVEFLEREIWIPPTPVQPHSQLIGGSKPGDLHYRDWWAALSHSYSLTGEILPCSPYV